MRRRSVGFRLRVVLLPLATLDLPVVVLRVGTALSVRDV